MRRSIGCVVGVVSLLWGCATPRIPGVGGDKDEPKIDVPVPWVDPVAHTPDGQAAAAARLPRTRPHAPPVVIRNATILTATGKRIEAGTIVLEAGKIKAVGGSDLPEPAGATVIDGKGRYVTPGIIDSHSHIGVYAVPSVTAHNDGNEMTEPVTAQVWAAYGYWPQDPAISRALAGGVTSALILPGSANLIGGRGVTVEMLPGRGVDEVMFPDAPSTLKMACGENPKRVYGQKGGPQTRMGNYAWFRTAFQQAREYERGWALHRERRRQWDERRARARELDAASEKRGSSARVAAEPAPDAPPVDAKLDVLAAVLRGEILVQVHCYRAGEMLEMLAIAREFGFEVRSFHHALEAYKIRDVLAEHKVSVSTWADWWGFKMEAFDGIPENAGLVHGAGGRVIIHSDSSVGIQRLNQEAAKAMYSARAAGIEVSEDDALRWVTVNPAWALGIDEMTGSLEEGKRADVVLWSGHPFSVYALPDTVFIAGEAVYDRIEGRGIVPTDFEMGNSGVDEGLKAPGAQETRQEKGGVR